MQFGRNDQEFDFIEEGEKKKNKKDEIKKKKGEGDGKIFDDLVDDGSTFKLPTLAAKPNTKLDKESSKSGYQNAGLVDISIKKVQNNSIKKLDRSEVLEQLDQQIRSYPTNNKAKSPPLIHKQNKDNYPQQEDAYGNEDFEQDKYEEDFQQHQVKQNSPKHIKKIEQIIKAPLINIPKVEKQPKRAAESLTKKAQSVNRVESRNSDHSQNRSNASRLKTDVKKEDPPNKYTSISQKTCPNYDRSSLQNFPVDKLSRQNDKMRGLIKKFNDQLNDMINRNIIQLKNKKQEKVVVTEDIMKVLEEHRNNNEAVLQSTIKDLQRLKGKEGELREEEYQLSLLQKIAESKTAITEYTKIIIKLTTEVNNQGNKLSKFDKENAYTTEINAIKNGIVNAKRDELTNQDTIQKLQLKLEELSQKIADSDGRFSKIIEEGKLNGYSISNTTQLSKRADDTKKKIQIARIHKAKTQALYKTKGEMAAHDLQLLRNQIKTLQSQTEVSVNSCEQMQNESKKTVEKAKKNSKLSADLINYLDGIIAQLQTPSSSKEVKEEQGTFSQPKNTKKYLSQKNVQKVLPQTKEERIQDDLNLKKPILFKKKEKQKEEEKPEQRVWTEDKTEIKKIEKNKEIDLNKYEDQDMEKKEEEKKKPFVIKKNKDVKPQTPDLNERIQKEPFKQIKKQTQIKEEQIKIAPRMMKFKRNKQQEGTQPEKIIEIANKVEDGIPKIHSHVQESKQQEEEKAIFAPKRFNMKLKEKKNEDVSYVATVAQAKKEESSKEKEFKPKGLNIEKQKNQISKEIIDETQYQKPKLNLKLKEKQKQDINIQQVPKFSINLNDKVEVTLSKQNNNPYANQFSTQEAKKAKQGPLKKAKVIPAVPKQPGSIYDQVQDLTNVEAINAAQTKIAQISSQQPDLHKLLGINKNTKPIDQDLIIDNKFISKGVKKQAKNTNFFAELEI